jgi:hypothetical protein
MLSLFIVLTILTGCYALEVKYNPDGSGRLTYILPVDKDSKPVDVDEAKKDIREMNKKAGKEVVKFISSRRNEKSDEFTVSFTKITYLFDKGELYFGSLRQLLKEKPGAIKSVRDRKGRLIPIGRINPGFFVAFHKDEFLDRIRVQVPGKVLYVSEKSKIINGRTVEITSGFGFVIFQRDNYVFWIPLVILLLAIPARIIYGRRNRAKKDR